MIKERTTWGVVIQRYTLRPVAAHFSGVDWVAFAATAIYDLLLPDFKSESTSKTIVG
jgi:hypothetical protein